MQSWLFEYAKGVLQVQNFSYPFFLFGNPPRKIHSLT